VAKFIFVTGFDFDEMINILVTGDDIHFIPAMAPVAVQDLIAFAGQPFGCQVFSFFPKY